MAIYGSGMTEQVTKTKLYHITLTTPYKQGFTLNQQIRVGDTDNPFFAFYENAREYGITDHNVKAGAILPRRSG